MSALVTVVQATLLSSASAGIVLVVHLFLGSRIRSELDPELQPRQRNRFGIEWFREPSLEIAAALAVAVWLLVPQLAIVLAVPELAHAPEVVGKAFVGGWALLTIICYEWRLARMGVDEIEVGKT